MHRLKFTDDLAVAASRLHVKSSVFQKNVFCFEPSENIFTYLTTFMIRTDYSFNRQVRDIFNGIIKSGLITKWKMDLHLNHDIQTNNEEVRKINMVDYHFLLIIFTSCVLLSLAVVLWEILINYKVKSKKCNNIWKFLEKTVSGQRQFLLLEPSNDDTAQ